VGDSEPVVHTALGDYVQAVQDYTTELKLKPNRAVAYLNRGFVRTIQGDYEHALSDLTEALQLQPGFADAEYQALRAQHPD
jgi:tetratricopeptide (TPR) repeat protein